MSKKTATVVGLGISGFGAALLLSRKGWRVRVTESADDPQIRRRAEALSKEKNIELEIGSHTKDFVKGSRLVIASPGAKNESVPLVWAEELKIPVIDEIELGYRFCPARIVAVTGTNGKSTTTTLIGEILKAGGYDAVVCGNIGYSFCEKILGLGRKSVIVLEVSSFQLQRTAAFRPYVALFLNITQNHLDRHAGFKEYLDSKLKIFANQKRSDWAILNYKDKHLKAAYKGRKAKALYFGASADVDGACLKQGAIYVRSANEIKRFVRTDEFPLKGSHNANNVMAATLAGLIFNVKPETIRHALRAFKGLEHRFEFVRDVGGVTFINDSKATTVDAAMSAMRALNTPVILIAGGRDKGSDFTILRNMVEEKVKGIVLIGEAKNKIRTQLLGTTSMYDAKDLREAVACSFDLAQRGDTVLLSPMCASFDMFKNFEQRGEIFKQIVNALSGSQAAARELCKTR